MSSFRLSVVKVQAEKKKPRENGHELLSLEHPPGRGRGDADLPQETWERSRSTGREGPSFSSFPALQGGSGYNSTQATLGPQQLDQAMAWRSGG